MPKVTRRTIGGLLLGGLGASLARAATPIRIRDLDDQGVEFSGRLELGTKIDQETGFVNRVRLVRASYELT